MIEVNMDSAFDRQAVINSLTPNNICDIPFLEMLEILTPLVLTEIPEGDTIDERKRLDFLLARTSNLHTYLGVLWARVSYERAIARGVSPERAELLQKKKEALYEIRASVKLKYEAASRKVTVALEDEEPERASYESRREARAARKPQPGAGWGALG